MKRVAGLMVCLALTHGAAGQDIMGGAEAAPTQGYSAFDKKGTADRWRNPGKRETAVTNFMVRAGAIIPAIMVTAINSELPGLIKGQVRQNVYDTATGKYLLIPQGSVLIGEYSSQVAYGQSRVLVAWQRIQFPDGSTMDIGAMPGVDNTGAAGLEDQVNNHYTRIFGSALLLSGITTGFELAVPEGNENDRTPRSVASEQLAQNLGGVAAEMVRKNMAISPTLSVRPGFHVNVMVTKDLVFENPFHFSR